MQKATLSDLLQGDVCIHVMAANSVDVENLLAWEILLHFYPAIKRLTVILIGPEVQPLRPDKDVCSTCVFNEQICNYEFYPMQYHTYVKSSSYVQPTAIIGFQVEFGAFREIWADSIKALSRQSCPILLTAKSNEEAMKNIIQMENVLGTIVKPDIYLENDFKSFKPFFDINANFVCYRNTILTVFKNSLALNTGDAS
ncbi:hypothetical protein EAI_09335 [Harpegnathos saltator]|uniref:Mitochondrial splicing suppressor 51-like C-terminal domain-containing protein n=1 Tax=Harpegnathos saltator TaxID=610380 RepID=E2B3V8_HARSA|nr:hypothetical protein EAI_09335 [Harpegnathos saltator]